MYVCVCVYTSTYGNLQGELTIKSIKNHLDTNSLSEKRWNFCFFRCTVSRIQIKAWFLKCT